MRFKSALVTSASGSVGGFTVFQNQYHSLVMRAKTTPVDPSSLRQNQVRASFGDAQSLYEALSEADKQRWESYASLLTYSGPQGDYKNTGRAVCQGNVSTALYLDDRGFDVGTPTAAPPVFPGFLSLANLQVSAPTVPGDGFSVQLRNNNAQLLAVYVSISTAYNTGRRRLKGPFLSETMAAAEAPIGGSIALDFLNLAVGYVYFARVRAITSDAPYRMSREFIIRAVAETTVI